MSVNEESLGVPLETKVSNDKITHIFLENKGVITNFLDTIINQNNILFNSSKNDIHFHGNWGEGGLFSLYNGIETEEQDSFSIHLITLNITKISFTSCCFEEIVSSLFLPCSSSSVLLPSFLASLTSFSEQYSPESAQSSQG
jgi:hypothetical protein